MRRTLFTILSLMAAFSLFQNSFADTFAMRAIARETAYVALDSKITLDTEQSYRMNDLAVKNITFTVADYRITKPNGSIQKLRCAASKISVPYCLDITNNTKPELNNVGYFSYYALFESRTKVEKAQFFKDTNTKIYPTPTPAPGGRYNVVVFTNYYNKDGSSGYPSSGNYDNHSHQLWVVNTAQFNSLLKKKGGICDHIGDSAKNINDRLTQILGLPPRKPNDKLRYLVQLTVPGQISYTQNGLFRPCMNTYDPTINVCSTSMPPSAQASAYQKNWVINQYDDSNNYMMPWTGQGYTYDWGSNDINHVGLSELVVAKNTQMTVGQNVSVKKYLNEVCSAS